MKCERKWHISFLAKAVKSPRPPASLPQLQALIRPHGPTRWCSSEMEKQPSVCVLEWLRGAVLWKPMSVLWKTQCKGLEINSYPEPLRFGGLFVPEAYCRNAASSEWHNSWSWTPVILCLAMPDQCLPGDSSYDSWTYLWPQPLSSVLLKPIFITNNQFSVADLATRGGWAFCEVGFTLELLNPPPKWICAIINMPTPKTFSSFRWSLSHKAFCCIICNMVSEPDSVSMIHK